MNLFLIIVNTRMKTFKSLLLLAVPFSLLLSSCTKEEHAFIAEQPIENVRSSSLIGSTTEALNADLSFCSSQEVTLCAGRTVQMGTVSVKTTADNITYVTYTTAQNWIIKELHLYVGEEAGIPTSGGGNAAPGLFPYTKTFSSPWVVKSYTFIIADLPSTYTVAAHASVARVKGNTIIEQQTAWADGCKGTKINPSGGGAWGTKFTYSCTSCIQELDPNICAQPYRFFFDSANYDGSTIAWYDCNEEAEGHVTVAGFNYCEEEGRAIYKAGVQTTTESTSLSNTTLNGGSAMEDAKSAFVHLAALKLSYTDYAQHPTLAAHVATVETWLGTKGKISPENLPNNANTVTRTAIAYVVDWIAAHPCQGR
jgi:hypothetical protein